MPSALAQSQMPQLTLYGGVSLISSLNLLKLDFIFSRPVLQRPSLLPSPYFLGYLPASVFFFCARICQCSARPTVCFPFAATHLKRCLFATQLIKLTAWHVASGRWQDTAARSSLHADVQS